MKRKRIASTGAAGTNNNTSFDDKNYLYLIGHNVAKITPYTHINCSANPLKELERHNSTRPGEGVRETKKAAGSWRLLLSIYVPPSRQIDIEKLMNHWRAQHRTIPHRLAFGVQMASQLMLLCFVNEKVLDMPEMKNKLPPPILEKIVAKLGEKSDVAADDDDNDVDVDSDEEENNYDADADDKHDKDSSMHRAVARYIQKPDAVFARRHSKNASTKSLVTANAKTKTFSKDFLDRLNTLYPVAIVTTIAGAAAAATNSSTASTTIRKSQTKKLSLTLSTAASGGGESICFTRDPSAVAQTNDNNASADEPQQSKKKPKAPRRTARRKLKFDNGALVVDAQTNATEDGGNTSTAAAAVGGGITNDGTPGEAKQKRRRKSLSLVNKLAAIHRDAFDETSTNAVFSDKSLLRRYGDILCDNIADNTMRAKTKLSSGQLSNRCLCGTQRTVTDEPVYMVVNVGEEPVRGFVCNGCQRFSAAYERLSLDIETFHGPDAKQSTPERAKALDGGAMDQFLESLFVSFRDPSERDDDETTRGQEAQDDNDDGEDEQQTRKRIRQTTAASESKPSTDKSLTENELQPKLTEMRKKMSQSLLPQSDAHDSIIKNLFGV